MSSVASPPDVLRAAFVRRVHGVRGEVRAEPLGGDSARFRPGLTLTVEDGPRRLVVRAARPGPEGSVLLAFDGVDTADDAATLRGAYLCVGVDEARSLGHDEWFVWQLIGLRCVTPDGVALGVVGDVEPAPAADVLVIATGAAELRYPMVREFIRGVDVAGGTVTVVPQPEEPL